MKLFILGNYICGNCGDSVILCGLFDVINIFNLYVEVDVMSCYLVSFFWLFNCLVMGDLLFL